MHITLSPQRRDDRLLLSRSGDILTINGIAYDFGPLPEGATLPREAVSCSLLVSDVERRDGALHLTLILPYGAGAPPETRFPERIYVTADGPIPLPPHSAEEPAA